LGAYVKLFKNNNLILFIPTTAFLLDLTENINIAYMNINYLDLNETQVMLGSMVTSIKWLTITTMILVLVFGYLKKK
jgi:hypothetical protein